MNIILIGIIIASILILCTIALKKTSNKVWVIALYLIGLLVLATGVYLFPASSWRSISIGALIVGVLLEVVAICITVRSKNTQSSTR